MAVTNCAQPTLLIEIVLIKADCPDAAYMKANLLCESSEHVYMNRQGKAVTQRYVGLHALDSLQTEELDDEMILQVRLVDDPRADQADLLVRSREHLSLFGGKMEGIDHLDHLDQ
ncbi:MULTISPECIES: DUF4288 domain-containing protein [unclassified Janthinobacterium]|uniref:DUF4288 domain-containing protein n=1 Tax=unclassified Janthinobacterium TaxID=2610881 RepID=UPI001622C129|nr:MULTISPECIES: DUF4288 domain-containing protein [unclassified Janthinobacterium]MBB5606287.1 hypothetical protein [Janthinobacterium sp. S3T4]MBB5611841.1 hypothetical protein [Janthinobacterium sp. S3M3]